MPEFNALRAGAIGAALTTLSLVAVSAASSSAATGESGSAPASQTAPASAAATPDTPLATTVVAPAAAPVAAAAAAPEPAAKPRPAKLVRFVERRLEVAGNAAVVVRGVARRQAMVVQLRTSKRGKVLAKRHVGHGKRFRLTARTADGRRLWVSAKSSDGTQFEHRRVGTVKRMRGAIASWYGPGLFGNRTACGQTLTASLRGVAHKQLRCGTRVTIRYGGRTTTARVVDRGPFHGGREFDLTQATARAIGFGGVGRVWVAR